MQMSLKCLTQSRIFTLSPLFLSNTRFITSSLSASSSTDPLLPSTPNVSKIGNLQVNDVVLTFREWFKSGNNPLLERIFEILKDQVDDDLASRRLAHLALSQLGLRLSETFVLDVLYYGKDVLSCLKFFDWAGRQPGYHHTRATFNAIFKILSRAKLMSLMLEFLGNFMTQRYIHKVRFCDTLVMGYAVAGKPDIALQLFGKMRFQGLDLDGFGYHVLLNALVEKSCFDVVEVVWKQITMRGFQGELTHSIMVKNLCKQKRLEEAEAYLRKLVGEGRKLSGHVLSILVDAFCEKGKFEQACRLIEEFRELNTVPMEVAYGVWIRNLAQAGKLDGALEFFHNKKLSEGYVPDVFRYNILICKLLRENRLEEVCDLLMEMKEDQILPDKVTMNAALCFFCKAGMVDVALELYNLRSEFGLTPTSMAYNYLVNTLCDGSVDEAYHVLKSSINEGYFPRRKTFSILVDALCRERKLDKMKELIVVALERNFRPSASTYDKFISALCRARRVEDGYLIHGELNRLNKFTTKNTYFNLIYGFNKSNRGDIAARLLIEMQEKGHTPTRQLFRAVICCLCDMKDPEKQFFRLLEMQLCYNSPNCQIYNYFIDGAGHARMTELAKEVYDMMGRNGIEPNISSDILMLQSYLKSDRISDALNFFNSLHEKRIIGRKLYNTLVVGLCRANKQDIALEIMREMKENGVIPSLECYEELVKLLCSNKKYDVVVSLIDDLEKAGRHVSSFIGNVVLSHSLKTQEIYEAWIRSSHLNNEMSYSSSMLGNLIGGFSGRIKLSERIEDLEEVIEQCFPLDIYTYNMLLRRLSMTQIDGACMLFNRICQKGYEPNRWTYDIIVHGLFKHGRIKEGKRWVEQMFRKGFDPNERTKFYI